MRNQWLFLIVLLGPEVAVAQKSETPSNGVLERLTIPQDRRLAPPRRVTQGADFKPFTDRNAWQRRVTYLKEKSLVATGLWPMPEKCPLNVRITSTMDHGEYVVENLYFTSYPGFYCTASLFRPQGKGPFPAVLSAHGHAKHGRHAPASLKGRDGKPNPDPWPYQARGIALARLGCIALLYDMVGYADSQAIRHPTDAPQVRVPEGTDDFEGLDFEMHCLSTMGLQTWNSIRAIDYLLSRADVDPSRIAISGASGGATQTMMAMMTDDRLAAAAPVCMVSTGFQGDCTCEQCALGKIGTDTVELCAAFAPKPLIVVGATGDWTKEVIEKGGPEIHATYALMDAPKNVRVIRFDAPHNYNKRSREAVHEWFNRWLHLGQSEPIVERPFEPIAPERFHVFSEHSPPPPDILKPEQLRTSLIAANRKQLHAFLPNNVDKLAAYQKTFGTALQHMLETKLPNPGDVGGVSLLQSEQPAFHVNHLVLSTKVGGEQISALLFTPKKSSSSLVIVVHPEGKVGLTDRTGQPRSFLKELLANHQCVLAIDPFLTSAHHQRNQPTVATDPQVGFFACFNRTLLAQRVNDVLIAVAFAKDQPNIKQVHLVGLEGAGPWCLLARGLCGDAVSRTAIYLRDASFAKVKDVGDPLYLPGALKYGDFAGLAPLIAPHHLLIATTASFDPHWLESAYRTTGAESRLQVQRGEPSEQSLVSWLMK